MCQRQQCRQRSKKRRLRSLRSPVRTLHLHPNINLKAPSHSTRLRTTPIQVILVSQLREVDVEDVEIVAVVAVNQEVAQESEAEAVDEEIVAVVALTSLTSKDRTRTRSRSTSQVQVRQLPARTQATNTMKAHEGVPTISTATHICRVSKTAIMAKMTTITEETINE